MSFLRSRRNYFSSFVTSAALWPSFKERTPNNLQGKTCSLYRNYIYRSEHQENLMLKLILYKL